MADLLGRRNQPGDTRAAMRWMPANGAYAAQLADEVYASDPESAGPLLEKAVHLNRYDAASWIHLGLLHEAGNDLPRAEAALLQAAGADCTFLPSWSLANFYFRHENASRFWYWAQRAAQMAPDDASPLFRLAWYVSPDGAELDRRLQLQRPAIEGQLVNFLIARGDAAGVTAASLHLLQTTNHGSIEPLLGACDWLIAGKHTDMALTIWNGLVARRDLPYPPLSAGSSELVTNGKFEQQPEAHGFDWRVPAVDGVSSFLNADPRELGFELSGKEPDSFWLMREAVPVAPNRNYGLTVEYVTTSIAPGSGIVWSVTDGESGAELARTGSLSAEQGGKVRACFTAPPGTASVNLSLNYQRQPGTVRPDGKVALKEVRLAGIGAEDCG